MASTSSTSSSSSPRQMEEEEPVAARNDRSSPPDMLDNIPPLPLDVLDNIFARLPFEQLVLTSRLSRDWRRRWEPFPNLDIWFTPGIFPKPDVGTLERCAAPVRSFTARVGTPHYHRIGGWLHALARKRLENLILRFDDQLQRAVLGPGLFSCRALARLELHGFCDMPRAPPQGFGGFPNLVTLVLIDVTLPFVGGGAQLERLISSAPQLRVLTLDNVEETWTIRAPNLRVLKFITDIDNGCRFTEDLPLLEEAAICIDDPIEFVAQDLIETLRRIASVKRLLFDANTVQLNENALEGILFPNLRTANLTVNFGNLPSIMSVFSLMRSAPNIEHLILRQKR
ncbi:hypothetical protein BRADI_3g19386v3 [Brachypodium distachyon]|uniref:Uncharacterized protein n=1 Tax=Brachypodium distachyon TaxID=15368 RepID=A0A2K2CY88_BRADI|nr:hypothetical protein BRADI_3g19386v3 [Brachypodium distachyon]